MVGFENRSYVMGIVNMTPDSFSGDGLCGHVEGAVAQIEAFLEAGVDILDIGGESTRPGAEKVTVEEEKKRVLPVIEMILKRFPEAFISVDTMKAGVAEEALICGAKMINDVSGLGSSSSMAALIAHHHAWVVLMDNRAQAEKLIEGRGGMMYAPPSESKGDIVSRVMSHLKQRAFYAIEQGIEEDRIILDPGIGFGKSPSENLTLIARMDRLNALGFPLLLGASRKSFIGYTLDLPPNQRVEAGLAVAALAIIKGTRIIRTHDVLSTVRFCRMVDALLRHD